jgi:hypothetical protein
MRFQHIGDNRERFGFLPTHKRKRSQIYQHVRRARLRLQDFPIQFLSFSEVAVALMLDGDLKRLRDREILFGDGLDSARSSVERNVVRQAGFQCRGGAFNPAHRKAKELRDVEANHENGLFHIEMRWFRIGKLRVSVVDFGW